MEGTVSSGKKASTAESDFQDNVRKLLTLKQTTTVQAYQEKFEELRHMLATSKFAMPEDFFISSFLSGLNPEAKCLMGDFKLESLSHAFNLARVKEIEMNLIIEDNMRRLEKADTALPIEQIQAYVGADHPLKCEAFVGGRKITVLVVTGLTCSFIDTSLVKHVGSKLEDAEPLGVVFSFLGHVAGSRFRYPKLQWTVQDHDFSADVRVVDIKAYDMLLGMDWLRSIGRMTMAQGGIVIPKDGKDVLMKYCNP